MAALSWVGFYHLVLKPFKILKPDPEMTAKYEAAGLISRFSYFENWRQYEHAHTLFWLGKDWSWNSLDPYSWPIFLIPTVLIAVDFIYVTWNKKVAGIVCYVDVSASFNSIYEFNCLYTEWTVDDDRLCTLCCTTFVGFGYVVSANHSIFNSGFGIPLNYTFLLLQEIWCGRWEKFI